MGADHVLVVDEGDLKTFVGGCVCGAYRFWTDDRSLLEAQQEQHLTFVAAGVTA